MRFPSNRLFLNEIVAYQELFRLVMLLASSINHEGDENKIISKRFNKPKKKTLNVPLSHDLRCQTCWEQLAGNAYVSIALISKTVFFCKSIAIITTLIWERKSLNTNFERANVQKTIETRLTLYERAYS